MAHLTDIKLGKKIVEKNDKKGKSLCHVNLRINCLWDLYAAISDVLLYYLNKFEKTKIL